MDIRRIHGVNADKYSGRLGQELRTCLNLKDFKKKLSELKGKELNATSCVEFRLNANKKEYCNLIIIKNDAIQPKCLNEKFPVNNRVLKEIVNKLSECYGEKADKQELAFLQGGFNPPGFCQVTLLNSGLGLYFNKETAEPLNKIN
jgi:hypothetical protein